MIKQLAICSVLLTSASSNGHAEETKPLMETKVGSMIVYGCPKCEPEIAVEEVVLEQGSQFLEVRKVGDDMKIYRTENWLGGSPVSYVHMPSNPDDKRFAALEEGPLDMTPLGETIDIATVASIANQDNMKIDAIGPKRPDQNQEIINDIAVIKRIDIEPVIASVGDTIPKTAQKSYDVDGADFKLRLN